MVTRQQTFGGITSWWVRAPGRVEVCAGDVARTTREQAIEIAGLIYARKDALDSAARDLSARYPNRQVYSGVLPNSEPDVDCGSLEGEYVYVLSLKRKAGKYRVEDAIRI